MIDVRVAAAIVDVAGDDGDVEQLVQDSGKEPRLEFEVRGQRDDVDPVDEPPSRTIQKREDATPAAKALLFPPLAAAAFSCATGVSSRR
jgi:hypothetical protein